METLKKTVSSNRPDLTKITQLKFETDREYMAARFGKGTRDLLCNSEKAIPELIQLAEMLFDMTSGNPESITHLLAKQVLSDIAKP